MLKSRRNIWLVIMVLFASSGLFVFSTSRPAVDFSSQVKPIFNSKCITCHGGVKKKGGFSVLFREEAMAKTESGKPAIIPDDPENSEMIRRINNKDPEERMPYKHPPLSEREISILTAWVKQGAPWGDHWAYKAVQKQEIPAKSGYLLGLVPGKDDWAKNDIDHFIRERLDAETLTPSPQADPQTLLRRVSLDLTGLPPSTQLAKQFLSSTDDAGYESLVDSLLASPRYGERWATVWLDLARYADTKGYEADMGRNIWKYRDWLIDAFNQDKPYDRFLTEQLAGDLLPNATDEQFIATAFQRNSMTNDEGGTDNEEFRTAAVIDRTNTTWEALMGTSFGCVQCHSHPYDPFTHEEYYKFMAFYNNTRDEDTFADYPLLRQYSPDDERRLASLRKWLNEHAAADSAALPVGFLKTWQPSINSITCDQFINASLVSSWYAGMHKNGSCRIRAVQLDHKKQLTVRYKSSVGGGTWRIHLDSLHGAVLKTIPIPDTKREWVITGFDIQPPAGTHDVYLEYLNPSVKSPDENCMLFEWFYFNGGFPAKDKPGYDSALQIYNDLLNAKVTTTPVLIENPAERSRTTQVFERGNWLLKDKTVSPGVPHVLNAFPTNAPANRLGLAMWMTNKENPLTARTMVNRLWEQLFGNGLVETLEDMGTQGAAPSHMALLDHLAYRFMYVHNWSIKKILREMVMSATYRQDSKVSRELLERDPFNKLYARGARVRLSAEQIRDQALFISGLLSNKMYGPPVMPWQPAGLWLSPYNDRSWIRSDSEDQYRRAIYTFWKRTAPYPSMISFDGVSREVCAARRIRTNTPLQALVTMNDSVYLEASRHLAYAMQSSPTLKDNGVTDLISKGYEAAMRKPIPLNKLAVLNALYQRALVQYRRSPQQTCAITGMEDKYNQPETAALVVVANALLNLDEFITRN